MYTMLLWLQVPLEVAKNISSLIINISWKRSSTMPRTHVRSHDHHVCIYNFCVCLAEAKKLQQLYQDTMATATKPLKT